MKAGLFATCLADTLFPEAARATAEILERLGIPVEFPPDQTCCGQMHVNSGFADHGAGLMRRFIETFAACDVVVAPSGSCVAAVRELYPALAEASGDATLVARVEDLRSRTYELSEFLVDVLQVDDVGARFPHRVALHDSCHTRRVLRAGGASMVLLRAVRDIELMPLSDVETCCGFGGTFAVKLPAASGAMLRDKVARLAETGAEVCTATDASCLMHIAGGLARAGSRVRTMHLAEILASHASHA